MGKAALTLFFIFHITYAKCAPDTTRVLSRIRHLEENLKRSNDSLRRELQYYKVKDDYYAAALSKQGTEFAAIVGVLVTLVALVGFGGYFSLRREISKSKNYVDDKSDKLSKEFTNRIDELNALNSIQERERLQANLSLYSRIHSLFIILSSYSKEESIMIVPGTQLLLRAQASILMVETELDLLNIDPTRTAESVLSLIEMLRRDIISFMSTYQKDTSDITDIVVNRGLDPAIFDRLIKKSAPLEVMKKAVLLQKLFMTLLKDRTQIDNALM